MEASFPRMSRISISGSVEYLPAREHDPPVDDPARGAGTSLRMERAVIDLPQPDSPTRPRVLPFATDRETPSTARAMPSSVKK